MSTPGTAAAFLAIGCALVFAPVCAEETAGEASVSGGWTLIGLSASGAWAESELSASLDLFVDVPLPSGTLRIYVEGSTTPGSAGVSIAVPESNADSGTALDRDGKGRLQVSELKYSFALPGERTLDTGLLDVTAYLDTTRINNDENMQFLGAGFLNNPTIEFPDYALGAAYHQDPLRRGPALSVAIVGSEGLADNPDASYEELFSLSDDGKGIFVGAEAGWQTRTQRYRLGVWINTADHAPLDGSTAQESNSGLYATIGRSLGRHAGNIRLGAADEEASPNAAFVSVTYQYSWRRQVLGLGAARVWSSGDPTGAAPYATQFEAYLRAELGAGFFLTPAVQHVRGGWFDATNVVGREPVTVYALRLHHQF